MLHILDAIVAPDPLPNPGPCESNDIGRYKSWTLLLACLVVVLRVSHMAAQDLRHQSRPILSWDPVLVVLR